MKKFLNLLVLVAIVICTLSLGSARDINSFLHFPNGEKAYTLQEGQSVDLELVVYGHDEQLSSLTLEIPGKIILLKKDITGEVVDDRDYRDVRTFTLETSKLHLTEGKYIIKLTGVGLHGLIDVSEAVLTIEKKNNHDTTDPYVQIVNIKDDEIFNEKPTEGKFIVYDKNLDYCKYSLNGVSRKTSCFNSYSNVFNLVDLENVVIGKNTFSVTAYDKTGNSGFDEVNFYVKNPLIDDEKPLVNISYPKSKIYNQMIKEFRFTANDDDLALCWYKLNNHPYEIVNCSDGIEEVVKINTTEGKNTLTVYARDKSNNVGSDTVSFNIDFGYNDNEKPIVEIVSPENNKNYENLSEFSFNVRDDYLSECWYELNGDLLNITSCKVNLLNIVSMNPISGNNKLIVYAKDLSGNIGNDTAIFNVVNNSSNVAPIITVITPKNNEDYYNDIKFKVRVNEESTVVYSLDGKNNVSMNKNGLTFYSEYLELSRGDHEVTFCATDNESATSCKTVSFEIVKKKSKHSSCTSCNNREYEVYGDTEILEVKQNKPIELGKDENFVKVKILFGEKVFWGIVTFLTLLILFVILAYAVEKQRQEKN